MANPHAIDFETEFGLRLPIYTERLMLRPFMPGDGKIVFEAVEESREVFRQWMFWVDATRCWEDSEAKAKEFYEDAKQRKAFPLLLFNKEGRLLGSCGYVRLDLVNQVGELGYCIRVSEQGNGYAREAVAAVTAYGLRELGIKEVVILCREDNVKSRAIPEALTFLLTEKKEGLIHSSNPNEVLSIDCKYIRTDTTGLETCQAKW